jgi:hypothetical protein
MYVPYKESLNPGERKQLGLGVIRIKSDSGSPDRESIYLQNITIRYDNIFGIPISPFLPCSCFLSFHKLTLLQTCVLISVEHWYYVILVQLISN